jgi:hypothetical protein
MNGDKIMTYRSDFQFDQQEDEQYRGGNALLWIVAVGALLLSLVATFGLIYTRHESMVTRSVLNTIDKEWQDLKDGDAVMAKVSFSFAGMTCVYVRGGHGANGGGDGGDGFICADGDKLKLYAVGGGQGGKMQ